MTLLVLGIAVCHVRLQITLLRTSELPENLCVYKTVQLACIREQVPSQNSSLN